MLKPFSTAFLCHDLENTLWCQIDCHRGQFLVFMTITKRLQHAELTGEQNFANPRDN